jgi:hypothetical protein
MAGISMIRRTRVVSSALLTLALSGAGPACSPAAEPPAGNDRVKPSYDKQTGRLERITYDRNGDGRIDATTFMNGTAVVRAELDENFDGTTDRWEHYGPGNAAVAGAGPASGGVLERVETTTRPDGQITRRETYEDGALRSVEEDTDGDSRVDKWETWERGTLQVVALDTTGTGKADRRLVYSASGEPRVEVDPDGTGTFTPAVATR